MIISDVTAGESRAVTEQVDGISVFELMNKACEEKARQSPVIGCNHTECSKDKTKKNRKVTKGKQERF